MTGYLTAADLGIDLSEGSSASLGDERHEVVRVVTETLAGIGPVTAEIFLRDVPERVFPH